MNPTFSKVLERLRYEGLLFANNVVPKRRVVSLDEVLAAASLEPRVYAVLPAIYRHRPQVIRKLQRDIQKHPRLKTRIERVLVGKDKFYGVDAVECMKIAATYAQALGKKRARQKQFTRTFRFSGDDIEHLSFLTRKMSSSGFSETLRVLIADKYRDFTTKDDSPLTPPR